MKIIFSGPEIFMKSLTFKFREIDSFNNEFLYINGKSKKIRDKLLFFKHIFNTDILFVAYVDTFYMKIVDWALKLNKKVILLWIGTDVMDAIPYIKNNTFNVNYLHKVFHYTNSYWLQEELKEVNIKAKYLTIYIYDKKKIVDFPKEFSVLTYVSKNREEFYGINIIIELALKFKHIKFKIAGIDKYYKKLPSNIELLGWIDLKEEINKSVVFIRYMKHDGESHSVLDALSLGRYVLYNRKLSNSIFVSNLNSIVMELNTLFNSFNNNRLKLNYEGIEFVEKNYNLTKVYKKYIKEFNGIFNI